MCPILTIVAALAEPGRGAAAAVGLRGTSDRHRQLEADGPGPAASHGFVDCMEFHLNAGAGLPRKFLVITESRGRTVNPM